MPARRRRWPRGIAVLLASMAAAACAPSPGPTLAGGLPDDLEWFLRAHPLAPGQDLRADEVARTASASWHVVQVATAERPHRHRTHELTVLVLLGEGTLTLEGRRIGLRAGDAAMVRRDRVHWFARRGDRPAVALVVFTPALEAPDMVPEPAPPGPGQ